MTTQGHSLTFCPRSLRLNIFKLLFLKNTRPLEAKFHMGPPWDVGMKICSNVPGHMTKMASRPIYGKNLKKPPSSERSGRWPWNLVCSIGYSSTTIFIQMMTLGWLTIFMTWSNLYSNLSHDRHVIQWNNPFHKNHMITRVITPARLPIG